MIKLSELLKFLNNLPESFMDFGIVNGEVGEIPDENGENNMVYRCDKPIISLYVDEESKEICFFHQTQSDLKDIGYDIPTKINKDDGEATN